MIRTLVTGFAAVVLGLAPLAASAQVAPGTILHGTFDQNISSNHAYVGEPVSLSGVYSDNGAIRHARVTGYVREVVPAGQGTAGKVRLSFEKLYAPQGTFTIQSRVTSIQAITKSNAGKEAGAAAVGGLIGGLLGHGVGAVLGAGGGYLIAKNNKENVNISAGSPVAIQVLRAYRQR
ncbi:MAG TPA: hypothetical protein VMD91_14245 [Candidatus Sulfotelmatobacter sp.]|nr:hypothetical protein [Candidatus Sulfotelmatobacter sp.]